MLYNVIFNYFSSAAEITRAISTWYFAGSYLRFSACYVDENNTIRLSENNDYTIFPKNVNNVIKCITKAYLSPNITSAPFKISFS